VTASDGRIRAAVERHVDLRLAGAPPRRAPPLGGGRCHFRGVLGLFTPPRAGLGEGKACLLLSTLVQAARSESLPDDLVETVSEPVEHWVRLEQALRRHGRWPFLAFTSATLLAAAGTAVALSLYRPPEPVGIALEPSAPVRWEDVRQRGTDEPALDPGRFDSIAFLIRPEDAPYDVWLDDIRLLRR
jgi:hypothetical protein